MPPVGVAVKVTAVPVVPWLGPLIETANARGAIATVAAIVAVLPLPSVAVALIL